MDQNDRSEESDVFTLRRVAEALGISPENLRALERRGRLPEGCEPELDDMTGTRYWTGDQVRQLQAWNRERVGAIPSPARTTGEGPRRMADGTDYLWADDDSAAGEGNDPAPDGDQERGSAGDDK